MLPLFLLRRPADGQWSCAEGASSSRSPRRSHQARGRNTAGKKTGTGYNFDPQTRKIFSRSFDEKTTSFNTSGVQTENSIKCDWVGFTLTGTIVVPSFPRSKCCAVAKLSCRSFVPALLCATLGQ